MSTSRYDCNPRLARDWMDAAAARRAWSSTYTFRAALRARF